MRRLLPLLLCLLAAPAWAEDPWIRAAAEVRVGDGLAALSTLASLRPADADHQAVHQILTARARLALGEPGLAAQALAEPAPAPLAGVHALLALRAAVEAGRPPAEIAQAADRLAAVPGLALPLQVEAEYRGAAARVGEGPTQARARLQALADHPDVPAVRSRALEQLARRGDGPQADRRLLIEHGHTAAGRRAATRLDPSTLSEAERAQRAQALFKARAYALQLEVERSLFAAKDRQVAQRARLRACIALLRLRDDVPQALRHCDVARRGPDADTVAEARYRRMIALGRLGRWREAVDAVGAYLKTKPSRYRRTRAGYQVGRLWHQAGQWRRAAKTIARFVKSLKRGRETWDWFVGWAWYRAGDCGRAVAVFDRLADDKNLLVGAKALYWTAKCQLRQKRAAAAKRTLATLADRAPLGYYGALGAALAAQLGVEHPLVRPEGAPWPTPSDTLDALAAPAGLREALRTVRLRVRAGFPHLARAAAAQLIEAEPALRDPLERLTEQFGARWARQRHKRLPWDHRLRAQDRAAIEGALPPAYLALARAAGRAEGVSPWWLIGHMLQESRFKARARSHAGALGPMQVLPRTGLRIAGRIGFPAGDFFEDELYRPGVALRHAAWYLAALRREFRGKLTLAIAAYNGGPRRFAEHAKAFAGQDYDLMVEEIGAHESRNYLRKVSDHVIRYAALYADDAEYARLRKAIAEPGDVPLPRLGIRF